MRTIWFKQALLPGGWVSDVRIGITDDRIATIEHAVPAEPGEPRYATGLAGLPNVHSHCFQRLMAGFAETRGGSKLDDFWTWRDLMYRVAGSLSPDDLAAIAAMAFVEMLESGFTRVGEFHYLHHRPSGEKYANVAEMAAAIASAAEETGIALTLLPVFYAHAGFGGLDANTGQRRFVNDLDGFACLLESTRQAVAPLSDAVVGLAPHSLRAVTPRELDALIAMAPTGPIHIHIAEQEGELADCLAWCGQRPVTWLLHNAPVDARWCLVHATHADQAEIAAIAASGAVVGLCPITEANLGDGIFPAVAFLTLGGRIGIGSDSNVRIGAADELQLLEYGQRLAHRRRTLLAPAGGSTGRYLVEAAVDGGGRALDCKAAIEVGDSADLVALANDPLASGDHVLDRWIFAGGGPGVDTVWRGGRMVVSQGRHRHHDKVAARYAKVAARLLP